ncbi:amidohydrolase family protein [uncultured Maribacter sp.]|uniref:amidohydrolase family protein n=1 Tax=uncultured Maribacter sp. TaxID=431308 RepID=UPI0030DC24F0|tara:strand:- start:162 stop:1568 length:1407 start_codon:yes stop_codon:yes gene_type:complete
MKNIFLILISVFFLSGCEENVISETNILLKNVNIVDVENGVLLPAKHVAIQGEKIVAIYEEKEIVPSNSALVIDGKGKYLIPGLWDMHTHFNWNFKFSSPMLVANGVTGVREMWGVMDRIKEVRKRVLVDDLIAPDIYSAGAIIDGDPPFWPNSSGVKDAEMAKDEVDQQVFEGVDFIKVYSLLTREAYIAIAERSKERNIPFAGHVPISISIWDAVAAGQQSIEHLDGILEGCSTNDKILSAPLKERFNIKWTNTLLDSFEPALLDSLANYLAKSETWLSPTLIVLRNTANLDDPDLIKDPRLAYIPEFIRERWNPVNDFRFKNNKTEYFEIGRKKFQLQLSFIKALEKAGVKMIVGTDYPNPYCFPGFSLHDEMQLMVKAGLTNAATLKCATYNPALFMGKEDEFGTVEVGKKASLILLDGNPLENITNTERISSVFLRGRYLDRNKLDELLEEAKINATKAKNPF